MECYKKEITDNSTYKTHDLMSILFLVACQGKVSWDCISLELSQ